MRHRHGNGRDAGRDGYVLFAAAVAALVVTIVGYAFFELAVSENKAANYRQDSVEAFYLADAAIERARARFLEDRSWRDGFAPQQAGRGTYELVVRDTTVNGSEDGVSLLATGRVGRAVRSLEVLVGVPPSAFDMALFVLGDCTVDGTLCLTGQAYIAGTADFGRRDRNLACGGQYTDGFQLSPPVIRTEPYQYPGTTYYTVRGDRLNRNFIARVFDRYGVEVTARAGNDLQDVVTYRKNSNVFEYAFDNQGLVAKYFDETDGVFRLAPGDHAVVVDFGVGPMPQGGAKSAGSPDKDGEHDNGGGNDAIDFSGALSDVIINGGNHSVINATVINTRFTGVTDGQRLNRRYWTGGSTSIQDVSMQPRNGIAVIAGDLDLPDPGSLSIGTSSWPALVYLLGTIDRMEDGQDFEGCVIILDDLDTGRDFTITFNDRFVDRLPPYFLSTWHGGTETSGTLEVVQWREVAPGGGQ
ncbi:MAG TPA: hypothetical protein PLQ13_12760 [Candidatus Krumholzibacteria bacterium]|nr:hypothetical protein [Candidatus Krumholzibacteria bacterium]